MVHTKIIIGLFRNRLNIGTLEQLDSGEYIFLINFTYRERLLKDNFPFDNFFRHGENVQILQTLPHFFSELIPERADDIKSYGITPDDSDWEKLIKSAIHGNPKSDNAYILVIPVVE